MDDVEKRRKFERETARSDLRYFLDVNSLKIFKSLPAEGNSAEYYAPLRDVCGSEQDRVALGTQLIHRLEAAGVTAIIGSYPQRSDDMSVVITGGFENLEGIARPTFAGRIRTEGATTSIGGPK